MSKISKELKDEILDKVHTGKHTITELAKQYGVNNKSIYRWVHEVTETSVSLIEHNRLKRENDELKRIIGIVTLQLEREKKGKAGPLG